MKRDIAKGIHLTTQQDYTQRNPITNGAHNRNKRCTEAQATDAFLWFGFAAFTVTTVLSGLSSGGSANMRGGKGGIRRGPAMSQV